MSKHAPNRRPVFIHEDERELIFVRTNEAFVDHAMNNDPCLVGVVDLTEDHKKMVDAAFNDSPDVDFISFGAAMFNHYKDDLGLD